MKRLSHYITTITITFSMVILCGAAEASTSSETAEEQRAERHARILQAMEEQRTRPPIPSDGAIIQPGEDVRLPASKEEDMIVVFDGEPVRSVAHIYASVTGKEILVSSRIGRKPVKMERARGNPQQIRLSIEETLTAHGVRIIAAGEHSIALVK